MSETLTQKPEEISVDREKEGLVPKKDVFLEEEHRHAEMESLQKREEDSKPEELGRSSKPKNWVVRLLGMRHQGHVSGNVHPETEKRANFGKESAGQDIAEENYQIKSDKNEGTTENGRVVSESHYEEDHTGTSHVERQDESVGVENESVTSQDTEFENYMQRNFDRLVQEDRKLRQEARSDVSHAGSEENYRQNSEDATREQDQKFRDLFFKELQRKKSVLEESGDEKLMKEAYDAAKKRYAIIAGAEKYTETSESKNGENDIESESGPADNSHKRKVLDRYLEGVRRQLGNTSGPRLEKIQNDPSVPRAEFIPNEAIQEGEVRETGRDAVRRVSERFQNKKPKFFKRSK